MSVMTWKLAMGSTEARGAVFRKCSVQCSDACPITNWLASGAKFVP